MASLSTAKAAALDKGAKRPQWEMVEMPWKIQMEPVRSGPTSLEAGVIGYGDCDLSAPLENSVDFDQGFARIDKVFQDVPYHDSVKKLGGIADVR